MPATLLPSETFDDRYIIERELGAGGMAIVYLARDKKLDRDVALKVLRPELGAVLGTDRFLTEIKISARLDHPHILTLIDSGRADGLLYYVLPFVRGESLRNKLDRERQLDIDEALSITSQVASALDYAHRQGLVHRDIKPDNILMQEGEALLADFGIALAVREAGGNRLTQTGLSLGTPQYMSPEQATGDRIIDARSDVYSLAAVLYELLSGEPPVTGANVQSMIAKLLTERPTRLRILRDTVPEHIEEAVAKALSKTPADRYASAGDFARAISRETARSAPLNVKRRIRPILGVVGVGAIVLACLTLAVLMSNWKAADKSSMRAQKMDSVATPVSAGKTEGAAVQSPERTRPPVDQKRPISANALRTPSTISLELRQKGILVLGFQNGSIGRLASELAPLRAAVTDYMITELGKLASLQVIESEAVAQAEPRAVTTASAAAELGKRAGAASVIVGGYIGDGAGGMRVTARLINVHSGEVTATVNAEGRQDTVMVPIANVAAQMRCQVELKVLGAATCQRATQPTSILQLRAALLFGRALDAQDKGNIKEATSLFRQLLDSSPNFEAARTALAKLEARTPP